MSKDASSLDLKKIWRVESSHIRVHKRPDMHAPPARKVQVGVDRITMYIEFLSVNSLGFQLTNMCLAVAQPLVATRILGFWAASSPLLRQRFRENPQAKVAAPWEKLCRC